MRTSQAMTALLSGDVVVSSSSFGTKGLLLISGLVLGLRAGCGPPSM